MPVPPDFPDTAPSIIQRNYGNPIKEVLHIHYGCKSYNDKIRVQVHLRYKQRLKQKLPGKVLPDLLGLIPNSSLVCVPKASASVNCFTATWCCRLLFQTPSFVNLA